MTASEQKTAPKRVYLIRHGITGWIEQAILHGRSARPLSALGLEQASLTAQSMHADFTGHVFAIFLSRAVQTAQAVGMAMQLFPQPLDGLQEKDFGWLEGKPDLCGLIYLSLPPGSRASRTSAT